VSVPFFEKQSAISKQPESVAGGQWPVIRKGNMVFSNGRTNVAICPDHGPLTTGH
jgi:hypothetical protein